MKIPENKQYVLFGGAFVLANKLQLVADKKTHGLSTKQWFLLRNLSDLPADPPPVNLPAGERLAPFVQRVRDFDAAL